MTDIVINLQQVVKEFPHSASPAINLLTATVPAGKMVGLVGPDGAGKTTLIRLMAGLMLPTQGSISICGLSTISQAEQIHQIIGYMPQRFGLYEDLTVEMNLNLYADLQGLKDEDRTAKFERLLSFTGLAPFTSRLAGALSGGMKQKLGLACALIKKPKVLLLDEPSVGVDPHSRKELWAMVLQLIDEGVSVIWSTAYLDEAERCDSVLLLNEGKLLFSGVPSVLTKRVDGRTFKIVDIEGRKRIVLINTLNEPEVIDGVIQGNAVRIVFKEKNDKDFSLKKVDAGSTAELQPTPPRFEDAFVDILGGCPIGSSELANITRPIEIKPGPAVEAIGLTKKFGAFTAAKDITFTIKQGEIFGLLGPNGAGKSTTFKMMCGLLTPTEGTSFINGVSLQKSSSEARAQIGYMAQKFSLYGNLSVMQNLVFFSGIYGLTGSHKQKMIEKMIEIFSFQSYLNTNSDELPLGFKQRLALACAVMHNPPILFLDEPTSGVDPLTRREFWNHINGLVEKNVTVMVTTHFMDEAEYCDRLGLIYRSKLISMGSPDELKKIAQTDENPEPTLEDAFIELISRYNRENGDG